jgi:hypothetical protein
MGSRWLEEVGIDGWIASSWRAALLAETVHAPARSAGDRGLSVRRAGAYGVTAKMLTYRQFERSRPAFGRYRGVRQ